MRRILPALLLGLAAITSLPGASGAREVTPAEKRVLPYTADIPFCGDPAVLAMVANRFAETQSQFWNTDLTIVEYDRIRPLAFKPWGLDFIPRRFCTATAILSDRSRHRVDYSVGEDSGFIGNGFGVVFCVQGLDPNLAYAPDCRMARP